MEVQVPWKNFFDSTCRIIPVSKWLVTPIYKPFRPFIRGITPFRGLTNHGTMVINHLLTGMILQVGDPTLNDSNLSPGNVPLCRIDFVKNRVLKQMASRILRPIKPYLKHILHGK